ncbi:MAG: hypothetical protein ACRC23_01475 [Aeromonas jandaei]
MTKQIKKQMVMKMDGTISKLGAVELNKLTKLISDRSDKMELIEVMNSMATTKITETTVEPTKKQKQSKLINSYKIKLIDGTEIVGDTKMVQKLSAENGGSVHLMAPTKKSKAAPGEWIPLFKTGLYIIKM